MSQTTINDSNKLLLLAFLLGSACSQGTFQGTGPTAPHEARPPHLQKSAQQALYSEAPAESLDPSWTPDPESQVSLGQILAYADRHSPILTVARSTGSRAEAARVAAALWLPANPEVLIAAGPRFGISGTGVDVDVVLQQEIQIAGERGLRITAADRLRDLTTAEIEQLRWAVHCDVHAAFHRVLIEQERVRLTERIVTFQREVLRIVQRQIAAGETAPLTLRLAQAEVAQAEQMLVAAEQTLFASRIRLAQLAGWPIEAPPSPSGTVDSPRDPPPLDHLVAVARGSLPSLRAGVARVREAEARTSLADREAWPRPTLGVQYRREGNPTNEGVYNTFLGVVSTPIPSFQRNQAARARARADVTVATAELDAAHRLLSGQVAEARSEVAAAALRTRAYGTEIIPRFEENLTMLRRAFELGEIDLLALSTGRERFLRIQSDALGAQQDYFVALSGLERVVGVDLWHDDHHEEKP